MPTTEIPLLTTSPKHTTTLTLTAVKLLLITCCYLVAYGTFASCTHWHRQILKFFIDIAIQHHLEDNPATKIIQKCYEIGEIKGPIKVIDMRRRIQSETISSLVSSIAENKYREMDFPKVSFLQLFRCACVDIHSLRGRSCW